MDRLIATVALAGLVMLTGCEKRGETSTHADAPPTASSVNEPLSDAELASQRANYPTDICVVSGHKLGSRGEPVERVVLGRLVVLCCEDCARDLAADPVRYVSLLDKPMDAAVLDQVEKLDQEPVDDQADPEDPDAASQTDPGF